MSWGRIQSHQGAGGNEPVRMAPAVRPTWSCRFKGHALQGLEGGLADAAREGVDDSLQGLESCGIGEPGGGSEQVLDLSALSKS